MEMAVNVPSQHNQPNSQLRTPEVGWYLYGVIPSSAEIPPMVGIDEGFPLVMIAEGDIGVMASPVSLTEFGTEALKRNLEDIRWVAEKARRHEEIVEEIMRGLPLIPMRFGTIFLNLEKVKRMLRENFGRFQDALEYLSDKEEWGLKGFSDRQLLQEWALKEDPELLKFSEEINAMSPGHAFFSRKRLLEKTSTIALEREAERVRLLEEAIRGVAVDLVKNPILPREATGAEKEMVINLACLVLKEKVGAFIERVEDLNNNYRAKGLELQISGPWPPYNFSPRMEYELSEGPASGGRI